MAELKYKSVANPVPNRFYYLFFGHGFMVRGFYKGGKWNIPQSVVKELMMVMSEEEATNINVSKCNVFELVMEETNKGEK